ncbi:MAG: glucose-6-phosphate isomerase, partial [Porticoccaceae bacterium]|nr:glucose-6-phosphate isomerase [Porticoccaceae bacterium]
MNDKSYSPTSTLAWSNLETQASVANGVRITELFDADPQRVENLSVTSGELYLDFSKNLLSDKVWSALLALAGQSPLQSHRAAMFSGEPINNTENRAVLHAALRAELEDANSNAERNRIAQVKEQLQAVKRASDKIRAGQWLGSTGKAITDVVNIG